MISLFAGHLRHKNGWLFGWMGSFYHISNMKQLLLSAAE